MKLEQFIIGQTFFASASFEWLCTDKGTRTITAIMLEPDKSNDWFVGPPYHVNEVVFDEYDMLSCALNVEDLISNSMQLTSHPHFLSEDVSKMRKERINSDIYHNKKLIKRDRVGLNGEIFHPYGASREKDGWYIKVFELFSKEYSKIHEDQFVKLALSNEQALLNRKNSI